MYQAFEVVPGLTRLIHDVGLATPGDHAQGVSACELALEALVARKRISRSEAGQYSRATPEPRRRPNDLFGQGGAGGMG